MLSGPTIIRAIELETPFANFLNETHFVTSNVLVVLNISLWN